MSRKSLLSIGSATSKGSENMDEQGTRQLFTEVALYRDKEVAILRVNKPSVNLNMTDLKELKLVRFEILTIFEISWSYETQKRPFHPYNAAQFAFHTMKIILLM